jgi:ATP-binding cassette subfamily B protein
MGSPSRAVAARFGRAHRGFRGPAEKPQEGGKTARRVLGRLKNHKRGLLYVFGLTALTTALAVLPPWLIGLALDRFINRVVGGQVEVDFAGLTLLLVLIACVCAAGAAASWGQNRLMASVAQNVVRDLRSDLFVRLQSLDLRYYDSHPRGDLMSRFTNDIDTLNNCLSQSVIQLFGTLLTLGGTLCVMLTLNPVLTTAVVAIVPFSLGAATLVARHARGYFRGQQDALGALNSTIEESITGLRAVKVFRREDEMIARFARANERLRVMGTRAQISSGVLIPILILCGNLSYILVALTGGWLVLGGRATIGMVQTFLLYSRSFTRPINEMANQFNTIQTALAGAERVFRTLDEPPGIGEEPREKTVANPLRSRDLSVPCNEREPGFEKFGFGKIEFRNVTFGYEEGAPVLKDVSFTAEAGRSLALVGHTGAGKTTIVNLLGRFYDVWEGSIAIDGTDLRDMRLADLRRSLGVMLQDSFFFSESVMENIAYGRPNASEDEIVRAALASGAHDFISLLPQGYRTPLSEGAVNLSRGQQQLLAISRVLLTDPPILVLDEATSNIDTRTEARLQRSILKLMAGRTSLVIAHRLGTIRNADAILVMKNGEIVERGTHETLLRQHGEYQNLYTSQFSGGDASPPPLERGKTSE